VKSSIQKNPSVLQRDFFCRDGKHWRVAKLLFLWLTLIKCAVLLSCIVTLRFALSIKGGIDIMGFWNYGTCRFFLCGMRLFFGLWLLYVGLSKWLIMGPDTFVGFITVQFDKTWSPHLLNVLLAWLIMTAEPILALLILSGKQKRKVWTLTALFMFMLAFGQTILMKPEVIANWQYLVLILVCAALSDPDESRVDRTAEG